MELLLLIFCIIIAFSIISSRKNSPEAIGRKGEKEIEKDLRNINFFGYEGFCLRNVYVPREEGSTSEIDLLYITRKGFFVIESKNYSGYIFGNDKKQEWTTTLYGGRSWLGSKVNRYKFYNPVWQNNSHIAALKKYLGDIYAISIIVFGDNCELKRINLSQENVYVCYEKKFKKLIKKIWDSSPTYYSKESIEYFYNKLLPLTNVSAEKKVNHVKRIKEREQGEKCPRCGGTLVLRKAQKGIYAGNSFYGCSNYPKCKYIKNN